MEHEGLEVRVGAGVLRVRVRKVRAGNEKVEVREGGHEGVERHEKDKDQGRKVSSAAGQAMPAYFAD